MARRVKTEDAGNDTLKVTLDPPAGAVAPFPRERFLKFCGQLKVQTKDFGLKAFKLLGSQLYILDEIEKGLAEGVTTFYILKARQLGSSTLFLALDLFWAFEYEGLLGVFATHDEGSRDQFRAQIDVFIGSLPRTHRVAPKHHNKYMLTLKNLSQFRYLVAGTRSSTNKLGRSGACNFAHNTEVAFWGSPDDIASLAQTYSERFPHRMYINETTANGFNHFADAWEIAKASPAQYTIFVGWWRSELNAFDRGHPMFAKYMPRGATTPLTPLERRRISEVKKLYGFQITAEQLAWYRYHLENKCKNDQSMMDQEQPWTEDDAFQSTGSKFFTNESLTLAIRDARKEKCQAFVYHLTERWEEIKVQSCGIQSAELKIWEFPQPFGRYAIGADPAYGSSPDADSSVASVFRCYADRCVQVAEFASPTTSTYQFAWVLAHLAGIYRTVMLNLEITGPGTAVLQELDRLRQHTAQMVGDHSDLRNCLANMRYFLYRKVDSMGSGLVKQWRTSAENKRALMHRFKDRVELGEARIYSLGCLEEMRGIVLDEGTIEASGKRKDDRPVAAALAVWAWSEWMRPQLMAEGMTMARAIEVDEQGGEDLVDGLVRRFMQSQKIIRLNDQPPPAR